MREILLAHGPWTVSDGMLPSRVVLRLFTGNNEYATHTECVDESGTHGYYHGHYFQKHQDDAVKDFAARVLREANGGVASVITDAEVDVWVAEHQ